MIDGLKPVQRRILWSMYNSGAKNNFTKTVKAAGMVMGYHPHGDASIQDALCQMTQEFTFANNHALVSGEGTFGDVLDPKAIASPRYTEVKISDFAKDVGLFDSIEDIDYVLNYDETSKEPIFFVPKIPIIFLNPITGIATGFSCNMLGHRLKTIAQSMISCLEGKKIKTLKPWYRNYAGLCEFKKNEKGSYVFTTGFEFLFEDKKVYLKNPPQGWNREKVILYLEKIIDDAQSPLKGWVDRSKDTYKIELLFKRDHLLNEKNIYNVFSKTNNEVVVQNIITSEGKLTAKKDGEIVEEFATFRKSHLKKRFERLANLEKEVVEKHKELIRFIKEKWHAKIVSIKSKKNLEESLKKEKFVYYDWLSNMPIYRLTEEEVKKCEHTILGAQKKYEKYKLLVKSDNKLVAFMIAEIKELVNKWGI